MFRFSLYTVHADVAGGVSFRFVYDYDTRQDAQAAASEMGLSYYHIEFENWEN